jgi:meso-butanediol dehydrogenase / (S,S)-butanediol dehydrogenase / diacetyl reductase
MHDQRLSGRVALVMGASRGIGRAIALRFADEGASVVIAARTPAGEAVAAAIRAKGAQATFVPTDVGVRDQVAATVARSIELYGGLHILVNNAAATEAMMSGERPIDEETDAAAAEIIHVGVWGPFWACRFAVPHLVAAGGGSIINIGSLSAITGLAGMPADTVVKGALTALTRQLAVEYGDRKVRVNTIAPGLIAHNTYHDMLENDPVVGPMLRGAIPLREFGRPEDVAAAAAFLASDDARYVTGTVLTVDGGTSIKSGFTVNEGFGEDALAKELAARAGDAAS